MLPADSLNAAGLLQRAESDTYLWTWFKNAPTLNASDLKRLLDDPPTGIAVDLVWRSVAAHPCVPVDWAESLFHGGMAGLEESQQSIVMMSLASNCNVPADLLARVWQSRRDNDFIHLAGLLASNPATPDEVLAEIATGVCQRVEGGDPVDAIVVTHLLGHAGVGDSVGETVVNAMFTVLHDPDPMRVPPSLHWHVESQLLEVLQSDRRRWLSAEHVSYLTVRAAMR